MEPFNEGTKAGKNIDVNIARAFSYLREKNALQKHLRAVQSELDRLDSLEQLFRLQNSSKYNARYKEKIDYIRSQAAQHLALYEKKLARIKQILSQYQPNLLSKVTAAVSNSDNEINNDPAFVKSAINKLNQNYQAHKSRQERIPVVFPVNKSLSNRRDIPDMRGYTLARHELPPGYGKRKAVQELNVFIPENHNSLPKRRNAFDSRKFAENYQISTGNLPPYVETENNEILTNGNASSPVVKINGNYYILNGNNNQQNRYSNVFSTETENTRSRYNDWQLCVEYLKQFPGIWFGKEGQIGIDNNLEVPPDFEDLPITLICDAEILYEVNESVSELKEWDDFRDSSIQRGRFTKNLPNKLPAALHTLFLHSFNSTLPNPLPAGLQKLFLGLFKGSLPNLLPEGLQELFLGSFNGTLPDPLPAGLQTLSLRFFNGTLPDPLPAGLQTLILVNFNGNLPSPLPAGLQTLRLWVFNGILPTPLPARLQTLNLVLFTGTLPDPLPARLQTLKLAHFNGTLPNPLPAGLQTLELGPFKGILPDPLPAGLQTLKLAHFNGTLPNPLPAELQTLSLVSFKGTLPDPLPAGLQTLDLFLFQGTLPDPLPAGLQTLRLYKFNGTLPDPLPAGLQTLYLDSFNGTLPPLPASLKIIKVPRLRIEKYR